MRTIDGLPSGVATLGYLLVSLVGLGCGSSEDTSGAGAGGTGGAGGAGGTGGSNADAGGNGAVRDALEAHMRQVQAEGFSGVVAVARSGNMLLSQGYGLCNRESKTACTADAVFDIGSLTKQFTAAAIMALVDRGELSVDDTLSSFFPSAPVDKAAITIHDLLTHTAGLPDAIGDDYDVISRQEFLDLAFATPLNSPPGQTHEYSNVGYSILGAILEVAAGSSYEQVLVAEVFTKAKLERTGYVLPDWSSLVVAHGYQMNTAFGSPLDQEWDTDGPYWHLRANGGLLSAAPDMMAWHEALVGSVVLSEPSKTAMFTPHVEEVPGTGSYYGYGWVIEDTPHGKLVWHNGGNDYFFADFWRYVDTGVTVFVASNAYLDYPANDDLARSLADIVFEGG